MALVSRGDRPTAFFPAVLAHFLPLVGVVWFDWRIRDLLVTYWLDVVVLVLAYCAAALFARRRVVLEGREFYLPGVGEATELDEARWDAPPTAIRPIAALPPLYPRNVPLVAKTAVWAVGIAATPLLLVPGVLETAQSGSVLLAVLGIVAAQLLELRREFFETRQYEELSAHMVLEIPARVIVFLFSVLLVIHSLGALALVAVLTVLREVGQLGLVTEEIVVGLYAAVLLLANVTVEWGRSRTRHATSLGRLARWFEPQDPLDH